MRASNISTDIIITTDVLSGSGVIINRNNQKLMFSYDKFIKGKYVELTFPDNGGPLSGNGIRILISHDEIVRAFEFLKSAKPWHKKNKLGRDAK